MCLIEDLSKEILTKKNFIVDIMLFLTQHFNPINLERKLDPEKERNMVRFLWDECISHEFVHCLYSAKILA